MWTTKPIAITTLAGAPLLGLALAPPAALAAPALALSPVAIPPGGPLAVTGTGFAPGARLELFLLIPQFHDARVKMADLTASAAGDFATTVRLNNFTTPPPSTLVVTGGGADLARATFTVTNAPGIAPERLAVVPADAVAGARFTGIATGLTPGAVVVAFTTESALGPAGHFRQVAQAQVPAAGRVTFPIDTTGYDPQGYDLVIFGPGGPAIGLPLAIAQFAVTAPGTMPGLPNTGGGWASGGGRLDHTSGQR